MTDAREVPPNDPNARPGYTFDPYSDPCQLADIHPPWIPFHTYRQIHISQNAFWEGYNANIGGTAPKIPECPPLWSDLSHYWKSCAYAGIIWYEVQPGPLVLKGAFMSVLGAAYLFLHSHGVI